jgi:hypothetical protein
MDLVIHSGCPFSNPCLTFAEREASMKTRLVLLLFLVLWLAGNAPAQGQNDYLDVGVVTVKPEKRTEFESIIKKMVDANRKHQGDNWLTSEMMFGPGNTFIYVSPRPSYAAVEQAYGSFMGAIEKSLGPAATAKLMQDFGNCLSSSRGEFRRRRWDLSANAPTSEAAMNQLVGQGRWLRTATIRVRPGRGPDYEAQLRAVKQARERHATKVPTFVSQSVAGQSTTVYYITNIVNSLGALDTLPSVPDVLGEEGYKSYLKTVSEAVLSAEINVSRVVPELSHLNETVVSVAPDFWRPKPSAAAKPKATAAAEAKP